MSELREAAQAVVDQWDAPNWKLVIHTGVLIDRLRAALAQPKTELRDQHKAFTHWYFGLRGINEANFSPEDLAWAAWKAALAQPETEAGVSWGGHSVRGDADSIAEVRRLIDFEQARQWAKPATGDDLRVYDAIAANYNAQPEPVAWRTFDGEGGYDYRDFYQNEAYELEWKRLNPAHADWVTPLYAHPPRDEWREDDK